VRKAVLVVPPNDYAANLNTLQIASLFTPPLGVLALGTYLQANGVPVEVLDVQVDFGLGLTAEADLAVARRVAQHLAAEADEIGWVGISALSNATTGLTLGSEIARSLPEVPVILGGYFPTTNYSRLLQGYPFISAIVRGDGEAAALALSHTLERERRLSHPERIPNLAWRDGETVRAAQVHPTRLADLPPLDFGLLRHPERYQIVDIITSRGCPFRCNYCLEAAMRPYACHSPQWVARQLEHLETLFPGERVFIYDPVFGLGEARTRELCALMAAHSFRYAVESRVDVLPPRLLPHLRDAHVEALFLGIESASPATLQRMSKVPSLAAARQYVAQAFEVLTACFECGITPVLGLMMGFPGNREEDEQSTLAFVTEVERLHDEVSARTGLEPGFLPFAFFTKVYAGSPLAATMAESAPQAALREEPFLGEQSVLLPSPGLSIDTVQRYQAEIARRGRYTATALERLHHYFVFSLAPFLDAHPELTDGRGLVTLGDSLRRYADEVTLTSREMRYDKARG